MAIAEPIRAAVGAESIEGVAVTISCGVGGSRPGTAFDYKTAFSGCDAALYEAKRSGRNRVCGATEGEVLTVT